MQQDVCGAGRVDAERGADDAAAGQRRLDDVGLEVLVEVLGDAHRPEADRVVHALFAHLEELGAEVGELFQIARPEGCRVRRRAQQELTDELALAHRVGGVALVGVGVRFREARVLTVVHFVIRVVAEVVAILHEDGAAAVGRDLQAVARELQVAIDLRP